MIHKNQILSLILLVSIPIFGMRENNLELFTNLKKNIKQDLEESSTQFAVCFNAISNPLYKIEVKEIKKNYNLSIKAEKKEIFRGINFKNNFIKFYKERVSHYKKPFEEKNLTLGTNFGEDNTTFTFEMFLKKEKEPRENLFDDIFHPLKELHFILSLIKQNLKDRSKNPENDAQNK